MPNRFTPLDLAESNQDQLQDDSILYNLLSSIFPPTLISILAKISNFLWSSFTNNQSTNDPTSWTSTLLPPLISLFVLYLSLLAAYRTMRSTIRLFIFTIKWGCILGTIIAIYAVWSGNDQALDSMGNVPTTRGGVLRALGKVLGWGGGGALSPSLLLTALPFLTSLNNQNSASGSQRNPNSRSRSSNSDLNSRSNRNPNTNSNSRATRSRPRSQDLNNRQEFHDPQQVTQSPLLSSLESLVKNLFSSSDEEEDDGYGGVRRDSPYRGSRNSRNGPRTRSQTRRNVNGGRNGNRNSGNQEGNGINQALNHLTGLDLENLNLGEIGEEVGALLEGRDIDGAGFLERVVRGLGGRR